MYDYKLRRPLLNPPLRGEDLPVIPWRPSGGSGFRIKAGMTAFTYCDIISKFGMISKK